MLLLIAVANTPFYLWGLETSPGSSHPIEGSWLDQVADVFIMTVVDLRIYPMFAFMFGYGMMQLYSRQLAAGTSEKRAQHLLQLRNMWLLIFGFVHAALLWMGDVLGAYGLAGLLLVWLFLRRKDTTLVVWVSVLLGLLAIGTAFAGVGAYFTAQLPPAEAAEIATSFQIDDTSMTTDSYLVSVVARLGMWAFITVGQGVLGLVVPIMILLAFWAGRRRILENPGEHLPLLRRVAAIGIPLGMLGAVPGVLYHVGVLQVPDVSAWIFELVQAFTGFFGGLGYVALFGLVGHAVARRRREAPAPDAPVTSALRIDGPVAGALQAVGKRSLTCYLLQSVLCAPILTAWGLGLGQHLSSWSMLLYAMGVWGLTVVFAVWQESRGARGPAEVLLRRLAYGRRRLTAA
ncbi:DUF418 domain-containing protein [Myceligenerans sp. TRM 65318]|uniref:DUF418 domain-containing protein n=2 Tax=Myceligenerans pegani TaxID=2776917 RepID=A0ABR9MRY5_9MICO|nr:DUF418 domain-containing protein [Myceligenerans sp. TRM 65318]MBE3016412.1 DUF418 domain-containing protein [Myceligenerans sp. TRM 65318]